MLAIGLIFYTHYTGYTSPEPGRRPAAYRVKEKALYSLPVNPFSSLQNLSICKPGKNIRKRIRIVF
jgi:hypothetical protein